MKHGLTLICLCTLCGLALLIAGVALIGANNFHMGIISLCGAAGWFAAVYAGFSAFQSEMRGPPC